MECSQNATAEAVLASLAPTVDVNCIVLPLRPTSRIRDVVDVKAPIVIVMLKAVWLVCVLKYCFIYNYCQLACHFLTRKGPSYRSPKSPLLTWLHNGGTSTPFNFWFVSTWLNALIVSHFG